MTSSDLTTYQLQLQQVEVALTADSDNSELLKLKEDLEQVIQLTKDLISAQVDQGGSGKRGGRQEEQEEETLTLEKASSSSSSSGKRKFDNITPIKHWQVGEQCQALWGKDGLYYEATINEITTDGEVSLSFRHNGQQGVSSLGLLKVSKLGFTGTSASASRKEEIIKQREYLKKKKAKKVERFKNLEKEREDEKTKWKSFSNKAFGKKGFVRKSIFKTPENPQGRVGIGTCGKKIRVSMYCCRYRRCSACFRT